MANSLDVYSMINKLQFHYWFSDKTHSMDALVHNKCEREQLEIIKVIAKLCRVSINLETEPSGKGGLKSWLSVTAKQPKKVAPSKIALVNILVGACMATPLQASVGVATTMLLDRLLMDAALDEPLPEQRRQAIEQLKADAAQLMPLLDQSTVLKKRRSNFYDLLRKYQKVKSISVAITDQAKVIVTEEQVVVRDAFKTYLVSSNALAPLVLEHAQIEIISPVLVTGKHKWRGLHNGVPISFVMKSADFMAMVQSGKVEFKSGSSITCTLEIEKKMNSAGAERIISYNILSVASYAENGKTTVTPASEAKQKQPGVSKRQLDLFGN